ncbi:MAG: 30S ribosome-binding factor RbfA [Spirochaetales bacterium]|nr:30S ribosome-binding factor RbfA [Spirochaetales bacterium]
MSSFRIDRLNALLMHEIGQLIVTGKIKDYRVDSLISVTDVQVSGDISFAKIKVSSLSGRREATEDAAVGLNHAAGFIQSQIAKKIKTRNTPKLKFIPDHSIEDAININLKIDQLNRDVEKEE